MMRTESQGEQSMAEHDYDLVVIGSGPAGEKGAAQAAYFGKKVALVERERELGGAAANTGTLPSKTLRETALMLAGFKARGHGGVDLSIQREVTVQDFLHGERRVKANERERIAWNLERHDIERVQGRGFFVEPHAVRVEASDGTTRDLSTEVALIATGSAPFRPDTFPWGGPRVLDSDTILDIEFMPKKLVVVGGGVIGSEYACTFAALGTEVDLIDGREVLLGFLDPEISAVLKEEMEALGVRFHAPERVVGCTAGDAGVKVELESGAVLEGDAVLVAAGRQSNTQDLALDVPGVELGRRGLVKVDDCFRTTASHVFAAGDVVGFPALASTSMEQARLAMVHAFDLGYKSGVAPILPYGIYTIPEVAMAGESEVSLRENDVDYVVGRASYGKNARGDIIGDREGFLKLLFRRDDMRLLGVHLIGEGATELVHVGLIALLANATSDTFISACFNYPTLGELYKYATYDAMGARQRGD
jgi:NAD(P) transhydrogenase